MKIVETVKRTYLAEEVEETETTTILKRAVAIDPDADHEEQAKEYVRGTLTEKVKTVKVKNNSVASIEDADEVGPLVELMMKYVPLAEKNAKANAVLRELDKLISKDSSASDEDEDESTGRRRGY